MIPHAGFSWPPGGHNPSRESESSGRPHDTSKWLNYYVTYMSYPRINIVDAQSGSDRLAAERSILQVSLITSDEPELTGRCDHGSYAVGNVMDGASSNGCYMVRQDVEGLGATWTLTTTCHIQISRGCLL